MKYEIKGDSLPFVVLTLNKGESVHTENGAMSWMSETLQKQTNAGGIGKMLLGDIQKV